MYHHYHHRHYHHHHRYCYFTERLTQKCVLLFRDWLDLSSNLEIVKYYLSVGVYSPSPAQKNVGKEYHTRRYIG